MRRGPGDWEEPCEALEVRAELGSEVMGPAAEPPERRMRRRSQLGEQFPMQILVPAETRDALRQRSVETGASIRHIILRSLAADGFPVPKLSRWQK